MSTPDVEHLRAEYVAAGKRLQEFCQTATAEEGWCHWCGDYSADEEAPALTRMRTRALEAEAERDRLAALVASTEEKASHYLAEIEAAHAERDRLSAGVGRVRALANKCKPRFVRPDGSRVYEGCGGHVSAEALQAALGGEGGE